MLTLNDGRSELWQWDTGRKLTVDADCTQVHFSNKFFGRSVDVDVFDGTAEIPDVLLQVDKDLFVWAFVGTAENGYTKTSKVFKVNKRNKPADYVFTPTEQTTLGELVERLEKIEETQDPDAIKNAVDDYLASNPIQVEETDPTVPDWAKQPTKPKYTAAEVGAIPDTTEIPVVPTKVSAFENDAGYLTEHQDLSGYAKTEDIPTTLPNPNALTFTGAATGTYDGSAPLTVNIPEGGTGGGETWELIANSDAPLELGSTGLLALSTDNQGNSFRLKKAILMVWVATSGIYSYVNLGIKKYSWSVALAGSAADKVYRVEITKDVDGIWMIEARNATYNQSTFLPSENYNYYSGKRANVTNEYIETVCFENGKGSVLAKYALYGVRG